MTLSRRRLATISMIGLGCAAASPVVLAQTTFNPQLTLGWAHTDNVAYVEAATPGLDTADDSVRLGVSLPVQRQLKRGSIRFDYDTGVTKYGDFGLLDYDDHRLNLTYEALLGRRNTLSTTVGYVRSQNQGRSSDPSEDSADFFLSERTERDAMSLALSFGHQASHRWGWSATAGATRFRFDEIEVEGTSTPVTTLEARNSYRIDLETSRIMSRRVSIGADYSFQLSKLDVSGDERFQTLALTADRQFGESTSLGFEIGGYQRSRAEFDDPADEAFYDDSGVYASLDIGYGKEVGRAVISFELGVRPTAGGGLTGTSTNLTAATSIESAHTRHWQWGFTTRHTIRDPADSRQPSTNTWAIGGFLERAISRLIGMRANADWADQSNGTGTNPASVPEGSFYTVGIGFVYYPLGRTRLAGGS